MAAPILPSFFFLEEKTVRTEKNTSAVGVSFTKAIATVSEEPESCRPCYSLPTGKA